MLNVKVENYKAPQKPPKFGLGYGAALCLCEEVFEDINILSLLLVDKPRCRYLSEKFIRILGGPCLLQHRPQMLVYSLLINPYPDTDPVRLGVELPSIGSGECLPAVIDHSGEDIV